MDCMTMDNHKRLLASIVQDAVAINASDIHVAPSSVSYRIHGEVMPTGHVVDVDLMEAILSAQTDGRDIERARAALAGPEGAADFAVTVNGQRLRVNVYRWHEGLGAALRPLPQSVPDADILGIPTHIPELILRMQRGLVLVNGPTGSGKSTTLNCLIECINVHRLDNIITIEEPIEYLYQPKRSTIRQREVGRDVNSFSEALRSALRQNPNVIVVGEIRDYQTLQAALQGAETGHLVFGTLHTSDASSTVSRIINMAPSSEEREIRSVLAASLRLVICQRLYKRCDEPGRVAGREVLINNTAIAALIREGKDHQISSALTTHRKEGMSDWRSSLNELYQAGLIDRETFESEINPM